MMTNKLEIISRKAIKPSSPTPKLLQTFKLSVWDKVQPNVYSAIAFFYHLNANLNDDDDILSLFLTRSYSLQQSLSETLVHYYPFAGRLKDASTIDCNDEGAYFVEARIDCQLSTFLDRPETQVWKKFDPAFDPNNIPSGCILAIQLTLFICGGIAICVSPSHKIADGSSMSTFIQGWVSMTTQEGGKLISPNPIFVEPSFAPSAEIFGMPMPDLIVEGSLVRKRFVFPASKIAKLKGSIASGHQYLSGQDLVLSLILKCAISASRSLSNSSSGPYTFSQTVNMRKRLRPPLPENTIGNIFWSSTIKIEADQLELNELGGKIRENLTQLYSAGNSGILVENNKESQVMKIEGHRYFCTSICAFPIYEIDFGWGTPSWVVTPFPELTNFMSLLKTKDGNGIEAWICLHEKEMTQFENDHELLAFVCTDPAVLAKHSRM